MSAVQVCHYCQTDMLNLLANVSSTSATAQAENMGLKAFIREIYNSSNGHNKKVMHSSSGALHNSPNLANENFSTCMCRHQQLILAAVPRQNLGRHPSLHELIAQKLRAH